MSRVHSSLIHTKEDSRGIFTVDKWQSLTRFLIIGTDGGTFYASEREHTLKNVEIVDRCIAENPLRVLTEVVRVSRNGLAKSNDPAIYTLAQLSPHINVHDALPLVCRTATHLFHFMEFVKKNKPRGFGNQLKRGVAGWYASKTDMQVAYQMAKYRQRDGWTHRDVLRQAHAPHREVYRYAIDGSDINPGNMDPEAANFLMQADRCIASTSVDEVVNCLNLAPNLPWEVIPTQYLNEPVVWDTLFANNAVPVMATVRNMNRFEKFGETYVAHADRILNRQAIEKSKIHPIQLLNAWAMVRTEGTKDTLERAFFQSFHNVEPTGRKTLLCLDVSGSMYYESIKGSPLTSMQVATAVAMVTYAVEPAVRVMGFSHSLVDLPMDVKVGGLSRTLNQFDHMRFGATDCSLPFAWAVQEGIPVEDFIVYTDSETNSNRIAPHKMLNNYRQQKGIDGKLVVVATCANSVSIAEPGNPNMLDVAGWSPDVPSIVANFCRGWQ